MNAGLQRNLGARLPGGDRKRIDEAGLRIPHPGMLRRAFVLVPLAEIDASYEPARDKLDPAELANVSRPDRQVE